MNAPPPLCRLLPLKAEALLYFLFSKVLLNIVMQVIHGNMTVNYVKLQGLEETAVYREEKSGKRYTGAALMYGGAGRISGISVLFCERVK